MKPYQFGSPVSLGEATIAAKTQGGAVGNGELYFGTNGSPSVLYVLDALTGEVKFSEPLPGHDVIWAVTIGSDQNAYIAGTQTGILYRYIPAERRLESLGVNPSNKWVWDLDASPDGKIYGSTWPLSKVFVYDIEKSAFTDWGTAKPGQDYGRGGGVSGRYFYAGIGTTAHLIRYDRETGDKTEMELPITGTDKSISNIWAYGGKLFVASGTSLYIFEELSFELIRHMDWQAEAAFDGVLSPPSPYQSDLIYFRNKRTSRLWTYNLVTDETAAVGLEAALPDKSLKAIGWVERKDGANVGRQVLVMLTNEVDQLIYDPIDHTLEVLQPEVRKSGLDIQSLETGPDGNLYMGGYQGSMSVYHTGEGRFALQEKEPHQIEGIGFLGGKVYFGLYGGAVMSEYDPALPFDPSANPRVVHKIPDGQSRPFSLTTGEGKLFVGTIADYGQLGGALTIYDPSAGTWTTHRNVVRNQSVIGLAYWQGRVFGGTTLWGGLGVQPTETSARLFEWDVASASKIAELEPNVPGFTTPKMIGELCIGPDGLLWGLMWGTADSAESAYAIFAMNPASKEVVKSRVLTIGEKGSSWRPFFIRWGGDGYIYTTIGRRLIVFNPDTLESHMLVEPAVNLMTLGLDGSVYYAQGAQLLKLPRFIY